MCKCYYPNYTPYSRNYIEIKCNICFCVLSFKSLGDVHLISSIITCTIILGKTQFFAFVTLLVWVTGPKIFNMGYMFIQIKQMILFTIFKRLSMSYYVCQNKCKRSRVYRNYFWNICVVLDNPDILQRWYNVFSLRHPDVSHSVCCRGLQQPWGPNYRVKINTYLIS